MRSREKTLADRPWSAPMAAPVATGSVASATTRIAGFSPRMRSRPKFAGICTPNCTAPESSSPSSSSSPAAIVRRSKYSLVRSAAMKERVNTLSSWIRTAVGRCFGSVLMA